MHWNIWSLPALKIVHKLCLRKKFLEDEFHVFLIHFQCCCFVCVYIYMCVCVCAASLLP